MELYSVLHKKFKITSRWKSKLVEVGSDIINEFFKLLTEKIGIYLEE